METDKEAPETETVLVPHIKIKLTWNGLIVALMPGWVAAFALVLAFDLLAGANALTGLIFIVNLVAIPFTVKQLEKFIADVVTHESHDFVQQAYKRGLEHR